MLWASVSHRFLYFFCTVNIIDDNSTHFKIPKLYGEYQKVQGFGNGVTKGNLMFFFFEEEELSELLR